MKTVKVVVMALILLAVAAEARATCGWVGTQFECDLGKSLVLIGTQRTPEPQCSRVRGVSSLRGCEGLPGEHSTPARPFQLEIQNVGLDPSLCRRIGNETYCY